MVVDNIPCLQEGSWLIHDCLDRFLLQRWLERRGKKRALWLCTEWVDMIGGKEELTLQQKLWIRDELRLKNNAKVALQPVVFIKHDKETRHYFAVVFDYKTNVSYAWGRRYGKGDTGAERDRQPEAWGGRLLWRRIASLFDWDLHLNWGLEHLLTSWRGVNWEQVFDI